MSRCLSSKIEFDTSTLEKIIFEPSLILENEEDFWENERSQKLTQTWSHTIKYSIDINKWREDISGWANLPLPEREKQEFYKNSKRILNRKDMIVQEALNHICQFLPHDAELDVKILFTAFIPPRCFANEDIIFNLNADYWNNNVDNMINSIVHEVFHVGYSYCRTFHRDPLKDKTYEVMDQIISEGICTYVGYKALSIFPAPDEKDYDLLENMNDVKRLVNDINEVLDNIGDVSEIELDALILEKCIKGRAYYIPGAFICQVIDQKFGRSKLKELLLKGPVSLISEYNEIIDNEDLIINI
ncbi:MAG: hypothetical protein GPJ54_05865 [Candidatus Heimdallarchaeota archaeon]|nr:hypothetical protein [Candidatus Heimdallarchaeota archaeon]